MSACFWSGFILLTVILWPETTALRRISRFEQSRGFLFYRTNSISQRPCTCATTTSCSCCETVTLIYTKVQKTLCSNFIYQRNGLNVDISLNTATIRTTTVTVYRPFKLCSAIPGSIFSSICVNVLELNQFPRSLTICVRHEIVSKTQEWQLNYTCVSVSTELPMMENMMMGSTMMTTVGMTAAMTMGSSNPMTAAPTMMTMTSSNPMTAAPTMMTMASSNPMTAAPTMMTMKMTMPSTGSSAAPPAMMAPGPPPATATPTAATSASSPAGGQMGSMLVSSSPASTGGMGIEPARRKRHTWTGFDKITNSLNDQRAGIINDGNNISNLHPVDLRNAEIDSWAVLKLSQTVTSSSSSIASPRVLLPPPKNKIGSMLPELVPVIAKGRLPLLAIRGARRARHVPIHTFDKSSIVSEAKDQRARIVNDKYDALNLQSDDSIDAKIDALWALSDLRENMTISSSSVVNQRFPTLSDGMIKSNEETLTLDDSSGPHDRTEYFFPSRIPPVVAETLEAKSKIDSYKNSSQDSINTFVIVNGTSQVIFPN